MLDIVIMSIQAFTRELLSRNETHTGTHHFGYSPESLC